MDSQLATVLTNGSLDVQNGSRCSEGSGTEVCLDPEEKKSPSTQAGNLQPCLVKAAAIRQDAVSINGKKPEVGGTCRPASQETRRVGGLRQPITVKTGVPGLRSQPITIKIVVPPRCKRPITNSTISLTKDFACSHVGPVLVSAGAACTHTHTHTDPIQITAAKDEGEMEDVTEALHRTEAEKEENTCKDGLDANVPDEPQTLTPGVDADKTLTGTEDEGRPEEDVPLLLQTINLTSCNQPDEVGMKEQTEPLDLSLPKNRESGEKRCGRFLVDSVCESSLIMEVDEYEGDGDRDVVEEDDEAVMFHMDGTNTLEASVLSPSFFPPPPSSIDFNTENLLLIDDQGIPYTLSPDGLKVTQVDASPSEAPRSDQAYPTEEDRQESLPTLAGRSLSQSLENALNAPCDDPYLSSSSSPPAADPPSQSVDQYTTPSTEVPEVYTTLMTNSDSSPASQPRVPSVPEPDAVLSNPPGMSIPSQPIQILTNSSTNSPVLLLSSSSSPQLSSAPLTLSLPLSVAQTPSGASAPMFLLLSSVTTSSGDSSSTSTPFAVLDPSTGQLSQITAASDPVSLPLPSGQVTSLGSSLTALPHPVIRLSHNNPPVILSGVNNVNSSSVLPPNRSAPALLNGPTTLIHAQINSSDSNLGTEAISAEEVSNESNKPSPFPAAAAASPQAASFTFDPPAQPGSEAEAQSPASETRLDSEHLPLEDHIYFSSTAAPPSPPIGSLLSAGKLEPLDPLDSPAGSPTNLGPRRVLYCQLCPRVFFYLSDLERHAITHSQKKPHVCQQCGKAFKRSSHLQRHKHIHTGQRNFVCPICAKRFREAGELQRHQRVHTGEKPYQCQLCHTRFAERNTLRRHTKRKHPYHQVAMEMLNERRDRGGGGGGGGGGVPGVQEEEESAEWYSSTVSHLDDSESET